jgi:hypothetical protein
MNAPPDSHARHVLTMYSKEVPDLTLAPGLMQKLIAEQIHKAVIEDRETLRERMECDSREPCAFDNVCAHHKALAGAILGRQHAER